MFVLCRPCAIHPKHSGTAPSNSTYPFLCQLFLSRNLSWNFFCSRFVTSLVTIQTPPAVFIRGFFPVASSSSTNAFHPGLLADNQSRNTSLLTTCPNWQCTLCRLFRKFPSVQQAWTVRLTFREARGCAYHPTTGNGFAVKTIHVLGNCFVDVTGAL